jgi:D-alanyl-D-alanine carboxypeptidase/D-alanyl-D-alanine-endopeptidase (penicillin-binding protein 4)
MKLTRYFFITLLFCINFCFSQGLVQQKIDEFAKYSGFSNASIGFMAMDCKTGEMIARHNEKLSLPCASVMKLFSTASAIEIVGPNFKPSTKIYYDGTIDASGTLNGNIWIVGGGDMSLGSRYFYSDLEQARFLEDWSKAISGKGIKLIKGSIIGDASRFGYEGAPDGWNWSDLGNYYGAGFSGLSVFDNMLEYHFKTSSAGMASILVKSSPPIENLVFHNYVEGANVSGDNSYIYGAPYSLDRFGTGKIPANSSNFVVKGSIPDPEYQVALEFHNVLIKNGITISEKPTSTRISERYSSKSTLNLLLDYPGKSILEVATITNHKSINFFAEGLLSQVGFKQLGDGSSSKSCNYLETYWSKRINTAGLYINDGSGLSRTNAVNASHFCELLKSMSESINYPLFLSTLPVAGVSGTLGSVCKNQAAHGKLKAKSGTMTRIKSYSGYVESKSGKLIAFAIIVNNFNCSSSVVVDQMEKVFNAMAVY